jgi:hypothetical protein
MCNHVSLVHTLKILGINKLYSTSRWPIDTPQHRVYIIQHNYLQVQQLLSPHSSSTGLCPSQPR